MVGVQKVLNHISREDLQRKVVMLLCLLVPWQIKLGYKLDKKLHSVICRENGIMDEQKDFLLLLFLKKNEEVIRFAWLVCCRRDLSILVVAEARANGFEDDWKLSLIGPLEEGWMCKVGGGSTGGFKNKLAKTFLVLYSTRGIENHQEGEV